MPPRNLTGLQARAILAAHDLRGLRGRAGISVVTLAAGLGVEQHRIGEWERRRCQPRGWKLLAYARVIAGLARHEAVTRELAAQDDEEEAGRAA